MSSSKSPSPLADPDQRPAWPLSVSGPLATARLITVAVGRRAAILRLAAGLLPCVLLAAGLLSASQAVADDSAVTEPASQATSQPDDPSADRNAGWRSLFDGKTFAGWEGELDWFRIDQGTIIAGSLQQAIPHNHFLCTTDQYGDFELQLEVKVVGKDANAGVQIRTARIADSTEVSGYQADVGAVGDQLVWGSLYDESRRNRFLAQADQDQIRRLVRPDDWNHYRIRCQGPRIELFVNGEKTLEYIEQEAAIARRGVIALQIHSGPPAEAHYRKVQIREW